MSWDTVPGRNGEGYPDPTASTALARVQHSQKGLQSKRAGEHFENMITASLNWYCDKGVAFVEKTPEPMKPLRKPDRQGRFLACYTKAGQPDFKGTLTGGRAVVFEAKHTDSDKIDQSRLTPEQVESLTLHHKLGAAAFIMVSVGLENFYRVPWEVWRDMKQIYGRKHMKLEDLEPYRVQYIAGILKLLEGVEIDYTEEGGTQMVMGVNMRTGQIEIAEYDGQIRGQMDLSDFTDADQDQEPEETQAAAPTPGQNPTGKPLDLKNRGKQAPAAAAELVPGRDYDPDTGEVYETTGQSADDRQTTSGRNNIKVVKIAPVKEA